MPSRRRRAGDRRRALRPRDGVLAQGARRDGRGARGGAARGRRDRHPPSRRRADRAGPNSTLDTTPLINELLDRLGIRDERLDANAVASTRFIVRGGKLVALPASPGAFFTTPAFSLGAKLALLREPFIAPRARRRRGIDRRVRPPPARQRIPRLRDRSVRVRRLRGRSGATSPCPRRFRGCTRSSRNTAASSRARSRARASGAPTREKAKNTARQLLVSRRHADADRCARRARSAASRPASTCAHRRRGGRWRLDRRGARGGDAVRSRRAKAVVLAVPAYAAAKLVRELGPRRRRGLAAIEYAPIAIVGLALPRADIAHSLAGFGFLVPKKERRRILGSLFSSSMFEGRAPRRQRAARRRSSAASATRSCRPSRRRDRARSCTRSSRRSSARTARRMWTDITRWPQAIPQYTSGISGACAALEDAETSRARDSSCAAATATASRSATASSRRTRPPTPSTRFLGSSVRPS